MRTQPRRILVLGDDTKSFLSVVRSLGAAGYEVHAAWCAYDLPTLSSLYLHRVHRLPAFERGDEAPWITALEALIRDFRIDLVLPTNDQSALPLQLKRNRFEPLTRVYLLPDETYRLCADKNLTWELGASHGVPVPRQQHVDTVDQALQAAAGFGYPLVLKPTTSATEQDPFHRRRVHKVRSEPETREVALEMLRSGPVLAQENFIGVGVGVEVLCDHGEILLAFQHERVHEPIQGGGSSYRRCVPLEPAMLEATRKMMRSMDYTGVAMVEFKRNTSDGRWILVEINARFWGSLALSVAAGVDFPLHLVRLLLEGVRPAPQTYRNNIYCRHWSTDIQWFLANLRADKRNPELQTRTFAAIASELWNIVTLRERSDTFQLRDPRPAWQDLGQYLEEKLFRVLKMLSPYRQQRQRRLRLLFATSKTIAVCCHGNICRSPFAAQLLESSGRTILSRGFLPLPGRRSPRNAVTAAAAFGVDLEPHRSAVLTLDEARSVDMILLFDRQNWLSLRALDPSLLARAAFLGAADPSGPLEISDPYGGDLSEFQLCYQRIRDAAQQLQS